jgi:hypothetical protein
MRNLLTILLLVFTASVSAQLTVKQVVQAEYRTWYVYSDSTIKGYSNNGGTYIKTWQEPSGFHWKVVTPAFNYMNVIDRSGYVWQSRIFFLDNKDSFWRVDTDTTGAAFSGNWYVTYFDFVNMTLRADSTPWYFGQDNYSFFYAGGSLDPWTGTNMKPTQFSTNKLRKIVLGYNHIVGLSSDGLTVYEWLPGNLTPHQTITLPRPGIDVFSASSDFWGYIMPDATGSQTMGYPYVAGTSTSLYGGGSAFTTPTSIKSFWNMTQPIKVFDVDWQAITYIDSSGHLWGCGWNSFGEVGNGQEFVGTIGYQNNNHSYGWPLNNGENPSGKPVKIGDTTKTDWVSIASTNWFGTNKAARDSRDSLYIWGRDKAGILGRGWFNHTWLLDNSNMDQYHYNAIDVIVPTMVTPISAKTQNYDGMPPVTVAAHNSHFTTNGSVKLTGSGNPLLITANPLPAGNGIDTPCCKWTSYAWSQLSGPTTAVFDRTDTTVANISNLKNGKYVFNILFNDNHSGNDTAQVQLNVNRVSRPIGCRIKWH